jgi:hypothetical protein
MNITFWLENPKGKKDHLESTGINNMIFEKQSMKV